MLKFNRKMQRGAASFSWYQSNGLSVSRVDTALGSSGNLVNFKSIDSAGTSNYANYPVAAGTYSAETWLRGFFYGTFTAIWNFRFWMSNNPGNGLQGTGLVVNANTQVQSYQTPLANTFQSSIAVNPIGTSDPGVSNVTVGGSLTSSILVAGSYTDFIVLQLYANTTTAAGDTGVSTFNLSYIES
jgi:hypothetical protein